MKWQKFLMVIFLCYCMLSETAAQIHENAVPYSSTENLPAITDFIDMPPFDKSFCNSDKDTTHRTSLKLNRFACPYYIDFDPDNSGQWTETPSGKVWRLGIHSHKAYSLYISMQYFWLLPGARMFVYTPGYNDLKGAFTSQNNSPANVLSVAPVQSDRIIVEINVPVMQHSYGIIKITKLYHGYRDIFGPSKEHLKSSADGDCNEDINCTNGKYWQTEKRAVCKIISYGGMGTGTLVGNTSGDNTPYVLTAYHIMSDPEFATEALFMFNYETAGCQADIALTEQSLSGATLVATTAHKLDFALLRLYEVPPVSYKPYYAGWDAGDNLPQKTVCIHHPWGQAKQIAIEYHPLVNEDFGQDFDEHSTWKVRHWELGTTEAGSSGSPLFNEKHRIVGTLTGGRSTCGNTVDDYFTKFDLSWDTYPAQSNQLKTWLDPLQTGQRILEGYDPHGFNAGNCDTAWNIYENEKLGLSNKGLVWGWASGHNSAGYTKFAEKFESPGMLQISGVHLNVAKAYYSQPLANIRLTVWEGNQYPERELYTKLLFIKDMRPNAINYMAFDSILKISGSFFIGYSIQYNAVSDTFALFHALDRGYNKPSSMFVYKDVWYNSNERNTLNMATSLAIGITECYGKIHNPVTNVINVYPNPCNYFVTLDVPGGEFVQQVECFDCTGRSVSVTFKPDEESNKLYFNLPPGIYFMKIKTCNQYFFSQFIILKE